MKSKSITVNGASITLTPTGFKTSSKGKVIPPSTLLASVSKGTARRIRKEARRHGFIRHAGAKRFATK